VKFDLQGSNNDDDDDEDTDKENRRSSRDEKSCGSSSVSLNQFCLNIADVDFPNGIGPASEGQNPLFWPFPLQGRPLIEISDLGELEKSGFEISRT